MAQVRSVVSEALEAQIRNLLPSQNGFSEDLQASNVITPIIDLTAAAEGTSTPEILQTALAFGSNTAFSAAGTTVTLANSPGFYRITGVMSITSNSGAQYDGSIDISDGLSSKQLLAYQSRAVAGGLTSQNIDIVVFLRSGDSVSATTSNAAALLAGSTRQIANVTGDLVYPVGFTPQ